MAHHMCFWFRGGTLSRTVASPLRVASVMSVLVWPQPWPLCSDSVCLYHAFPGPRHLVWVRIWLASELLIILESSVSASNCTEFSFLKQRFSAFRIHYYVTNFYSIYFSSSYWLFYGFMKLCLFIFWVTHPNENVFWLGMTFKSPGRGLNSII